MGLAIFTSSGMFYPSMYGLEVGDLIQALAVGAGAGGGFGGYTSSPSIGGGLSGKMAIKSHILQNTDGISVTVGVGGNGGISPGGGDATAGSSSSFGSIVTAPGGAATGNRMPQGSGGNGGYYPGLNRPFARGTLYGNTSNDSGGSGGLEGTAVNGAPGIVPFGGTPASGGNYGRVGDYYRGGGCGGLGYGAGGGAGGPVEYGGPGASGLVIVTW